MNDISQALISISTDLIVAFDTRLLITEWNKNLELQYAIRKDAALGRNIYDIFSEISKDSDAWILIEVLKGKKVFLNKRPYKNKPGFTQAHFVPLYNAESVVSGGLIIFHDITGWKEALERKRKINSELRKINEELVIQIGKKEEAQQELKKAHDELEQRVIERTAALNEAKLKAEDADKAKARFLANTSHEIRNSMNAVIGFSNMLNKTRLNKTQASYLKRINFASHILHAIIEDILDTSRIEAGKIEFEHSQFRLKDFINGLVQIVSGNISSRSAVKVSYKIDKAIPAVLKGDKMRLGQILLNLLNNAIKFTEQGTILLTLQLIKQKKQEITIQFMVKDTGVGIPEDKLGEIFDRFVQGNTSTTKLYGGTGLGLTIVKQLVHLQGGTLNVNSVLNEGSTFSFTLPFSVADEQNHLNSFERLLKEINRSELSILNVEDNFLNTVILTNLLDEFSIKLTTAKNGKVAIKELQKNAYDLILMDIKMPVMDGFETTRRIRVMEDERLNSIPIIAISGHKSKEEQEKCRQIGMNEYLMKPLDLDLLMAVFCRIFTKQNEHV